MKCLSNELQFGELEEAVKSADTPEEINNGPATAPSVRLMKAIAGYNKVVYGACLASEIGQRCKGEDIFRNSQRKQDNQDGYSRVYHKTLWVKYLSTISTE